MKTPQVIAAVLSLVALSLWLALGPGQAHHDPSPQAPSQDQDRGGEQPAEPPATTERAPAPEAPSSVHTMDGFPDPNANPELAGWVMPTVCKVCGKELVCPDHLNPLSCPLDFLGQDVPQGVKCAFGNLPTQLEKLRSLPREKQTASNISMAYLMWIEFDKWTGNKLWNPGHDIMGWPANLIPTPVPGMNGEQPGDPGWSDYVGSATLVGPLSWHYSEYPDWVSAWEVTVKADLVFGQLERARSEAVWNGDEILPSVQMPDGSWAAPEAAWSNMMSTVESYYDWLVEQYELAKH